MSEVWRSIPGLPAHEASSLGRIRRATSRKGRPAGMILKQRLRPSGYAIVSISATKHFVHRLVCSAFHGAPSAGQEVSHEDGDRSNNEPANLCWRTHRDNEALKVAHGTKAEGSKSGHAKVDEVAVITIRSAHRLWKHTHAEIGEFFGLSRASVGDIINRKTWRHVE